MHNWMGERFANEQRNREYAKNPANELRDDIKHSVPVLHLAEPPKRHRYSWIEVCAGPFPKRRENQRDGRATHRDASQHSAHEFAWNDAWNWRVRMPEQDREEPGRDHKDPELSGFAEVFRPVFFERANHN